MLRLCNTRAGWRGDGTGTARDPRDPRRPAGEAAVTEHPNVELPRRGYEAFAKGDLTTLSELIADDVTWHVAGAGPLSGTYHGRDEVLGFFGRLAEETVGTLRLAVHDVLAPEA